MMHSLDSTHRRSRMSTRVVNQTRMSRELFPWSIIIPHLEQQSRRAHQAQLAEHAASLIDMWQQMTYSSCYNFIESFQISFFTPQFGQKLRALLGPTAARELVLQSMESEKTKEYIGLDNSTAWHSGGQAWRYYMLLAGYCVVDHAPERSEPPTPLWRGRLQDEDGRFGRNWERECTIHTGLTGLISQPDDSSTTWRVGVTTRRWL